VQREQLHHRSALSRFYERRLVWFREGDLLLYLPAYDADTQTFQSPVVYRFVDGLISEVIEARALRHDAGGWRLEDARLQRAADATVATLGLLRLELAVSPTDLVDITGDPRQLRGAEVRALIGRREKAGVDTTSHRIELYNRTAAPFSAIWMFALVAPWALHPERRRSMARTLGAGVITVAVLLSVAQTFRVLALRHSIPVELGAYGAALVSVLVLPLSLLAYRRFRIRGTVF
jgi:lipopolysaccharide export LptBFGC system permease protein LptF